MKRSTGWAIVALGLLQAGFAFAETPLTLDQRRANQRELAAQSRQREQAADEQAYSTLVRQVFNGRPPANLEEAVTRIGDHFNLSIVPQGPADPKGGQGFDVFR